MKQSLTARDFFIESVRSLMRETQAAPSDFSIHLRNQIVIGKKRDGRERIRRRTVLFIHQEDGALIGKINTRTVGGELEPLRVCFDKQRRAWKPEQDFQD